MNRDQITDRVQDMSSDDLHAMHKSISRYMRRFYRWDLPTFRISYPQIAAWLEEICYELDEREHPFPRGWRV